MKKKILIADDNEEIVQLLIALFTPLGHEIFIARDGSEVFSVCRREKPHLVVLDIMMPCFTGFQVLRRLKKDEVFKPYPKVLMLSVKSQPRDIQQAEQFGCDAYLIKPFEPKELVKKVVELLDKKDFTQ
ncbi:MAG: response regulator [Elusimicrobia bacterium]|nr:response regulator [Elusimicrobiota bacterium]